MDDQRYTLSDFIAETSQQDREQGKFELENPRMLEIHVDGMIWTKMGAMIAYKGQLKFEREGILEHGLGKMLKRAVSGEGTPLTKATGKGTLYCADAGKKVSIINLQNEEIYVQGNDLLAFEESIEWDIKIIRKIAGMLAGGLFAVHLKGTGMIAITTHGDPTTLKATAAEPVITDPNATVAWSGNLFPDLKTDISLKSFFGRQSGESFQMVFKGDGFVVVQPYEEVSYSGS